MGERHFPRKSGRRIDEKSIGRNGGGPKTWFWRWFMDKPHQNDRCTPVRSAWAREELPEPDNDLTRCEIEAKSTL